MIKRLVFLIASISLLISSSISAQHRCDEADMFEPLLGEWNAYRISEAENTHLGQLSTQLVVKGCAFKQRFTAANTDLKDNFSYESFGFINEKGQWLEIVVTSSGVVRHYSWEQNEEEFILDQRGNSGSIRNRLVLFDLAEEQYQLLGEQSDDRGQTWNRRYLMHLIRQPTGAQAD